MQKYSSRAFYLDAYILHTYIYIPFTLPDVKSNELLRIIFSAVLHTFRDTIERVSSEILNRREENDPSSKKRKMEDALRRRRGKR